MTKTFFLTLTFAAASFAGEWTGFISDASCGAANAKATAEAKECAQRCVKGGAAPVFVTGDNKVINIANPDKVKALVGEKVKVTGSLDKGTLKVESIAKAS